MTQNHPDLSVRRQCSLLSLARSTLYYQPRGESAENLAFMEIIDRQFLETPWYGSRQMARHIQREGHGCGRHRVRRLMRLMRLVPIRRPSGSCVARSREGTKSPGRARSTRNTRFIHTCSGTCRSPGPIRSSSRDHAAHDPAGQRVYRHHVHSHAPRVSVSGGNHGLAQPKGAELAAVKFHGRRVLHRGLEGGAGQIRPAGDIQLRPGFPVHQHRLHRRAARCQGEDLHGRTRPLAPLFVCRQTTAGQRTTE